MPIPPSIQPTRSYPLARPEGSDDPRFRLGLVLDVAAVLARHDYPPVTAGADLLHLAQALLTTIYREHP
jgi:hypothetical protein